MSILLVVAVLYILSAIVHYGILAKYGKSPTSVPVAIFGTFYLILGVLLFWDVGAGWIIYAALAITVVGLIGATATLKSVPEQRAVTITMNALDVIIIALLGFVLLS